MDFTVDGKLHKLIIQKVDEKDTGVYSANYKKLTTSAKVSLQGKLQYTVISVVHEFTN